MPYRLKNHGLTNLDKVFWNLPTPGLYEEAVRRREGLVTHLGPFAVRTGDYTGRSPNDRFIVREETSEDRIWWGEANREFEPERFDALFARLTAYFQCRDVFVQDCYAGADPKHRVPIRVINETAWHNLFARNMFVRIHDEKMLEKHVPEFVVIHAPGFHAVPELDGTNSEAFVLIHIGKKMVIIGGTRYAGEIKKSIFSILNFLYPQEKILSMHCSANQGADGDAALFFGLSGTGKTTLSADPQRALIGDDEHGWDEDGIFNFEGGCYAKVIRLSKENEPEIYETTRKFGTILENVWVDSNTRRIDLDNDSMTENTRAAYPITHIPNSIREGQGGHPSNIIMLTLDAFGVLPPIAKLSPAQAMYHFLSGYTAKVAGTERGVTEPKAVFSPCFGAPFLTLPPSVYAQLLGEKIKQHNANCWLVNTGWTGGPFGEGQRMSLPHTRATIKAALSGELAKAPTRTDPAFGLEVPTECEGIPAEVLEPRKTWADPEAYDQKALELAERFRKNFELYAENVTDEVRNAGPKGKN